MSKSEECITSSDPPALLNEIDKQLEALMAPLRSALRNRSCVLLIPAWQKTPYFLLLAFHLHLRWPGLLNELPLNPRIGIVPFFEGDHLVASTPLYDIREVIQQRRDARVGRGRERGFSGDYVVQDWESRAERRLSRLRTLVLPGASYVAIDQVTLDGRIVLGHRAVLGRIASRTGPRPFILVPTKRGLSRKAAEAFRETDLLLVNAQGLRGRRMTASVQALLAQCVGAVPMLVLAASPSDVLPLVEEIPADHVQLSFVGNLPSSLSMSVASVGRDRPSAERELEFAIQGLDAEVPRLADAVQLARAAWWAARQALHQSATEPPEVRRFLLAYERAISDAPVEAARLTAVRELLTREVVNRELQDDRARAVTDAVLNTPGNSGTLVLVRDEDEARHLKTALTNQLELPAEALEDLGVHVTGRRGYWPDRPFGVALAAGYYGTRTLDVLLASRAPVLRLVFDPIEARAAWFHLQKTVELLESAHAEQAGVLVRGIARELSRYVATFGDVVEVSLQVSDSKAISAGDGAVRSRPTSPQNVVIVFADGSTIEVNQHARFEVIREAGKRLKTLRAAELEPGDQVAVLHEDSRALFSEQLLATLDQGPLVDQAQKRATWLSIVQSVAATRRATAQAILQAMQEHGLSVNLTTVRSWLKSDRADEASVPDRPDRFMGFAAALGITLPPETLLDLYGGIQKWRVNHRKFGRALVRAIRAAYLGRLDAATLRKIERDWGFNARQLVEGARIAIVDEVILPEGTEDAAH